MAKTVLGIAAVAVVLIAAAVVALLAVDWNDHRATIAEKASAAVGRTVEINGDLGVHLWSWTPEIVVKDVVIGNPDWASGPEMARVAEAYARFRVRPMLQGRLEIDRIRLVKPVIDLERRDGKANWKFGPDEEADPDAREDFPVLRDVQVEDGVLRYRSPDIEPIEVRVEMLRLQAGGPEAPVKVNLEGTYEDRPFALKGQGDSFSAFRSTDEAYDLTLDARIGETSLRISGGIWEPVALRSADMKVELEGKSLAEIYEVFTLPLPETPPYAISGQLGREADKWTLRGFRARLGESDLRGDLEVATGGERIRLTAELLSDSFRVSDLEGFWSGKQEESPEQPREPQERLLSDEPIPLEKLRRLDANVRFTGNAVQQGPLRLENLTAVLGLKDGLLTLKPLELGLAEGRIVAGLRLDGRREVPEMAADVDVEGLDLAALLALLGKENAGAGLLRGRVDLATRGRSMHELGAGANGNGALVMSGGKIQNILLEVLALDLQEAAGQWLSADDEYVTVRCLAMPTRIREGRLLADPWILDVDDALVRITGFVDLGTEKVKVEIRPIPKDFSLFNYLTSIDITGDLARREAQTSPLEAAGKLALKTIAAPFMPLLSEPIQEEAREQSVPCENLRQRFEQSLAEDGTTGGTPTAEPAPQGSTPQPPPQAERNTAGAPPPVERIQAALSRDGFELKVDGIMGPQTRSALRAYQQREGLPPTGEPDAATLRALGLVPAGG